MSATTKASCELQLDQVVSDIHLMVDFARSEGKPLPETIRQQLSELCYDDDRNGVTPPGPNTLISADQRHFSKALELHAALSLLVAPATPVTIRASKTDGKLWIENLTIRFLLSFSLLSLLLFLIAAVVQEIRLVAAEAANASKKSDAVLSQKTNFVSQSGAYTNNITRPETATLSPTNIPTPSANLPSKSGPLGYWSIVMLVAAAGLGSGFYGLYTAHKYIVDRTFDPKYNQIYMVRYVLGLTSGVILGYFGTTLINPSGQTNPKIASLGPAVLALVGGYAAEAVSQILQRVADTLVTLVRGSNEDVLEASKKELAAKSKQEETQKKMDLLKPLQEAKDAAMTPGPNALADAKTAIQKAIDGISKSI